MKPKLIFSFASFCSMPDKSSVPQIVVESEIRNNEKYYTT